MTVFLVFREKKIKTLSKTQKKPHAGPVPVETSIGTGLALEIHNNKTQPRF